MWFTVSASRPTSDSMYQIWRIYLQLFWVVVRKDRQTDREGLPLYPCSSPWGRVSYRQSHNHFQLSREKT